MKLRDWVRYILALVGVGLGNLVFTAVTGIPGLTDDTLVVLACFFTVMSALREEPKPDFEDDCN